MKFSLEPKLERSNVPHLVITVDDLSKSIEEVNANGGKVTGEIMVIPGVGKYASFKDSGGNGVGMLQPVSREK